MPVLQSKRVEWVPSQNTGSKNQIPGTRNKQGPSSTDKHHLLQHHLLDLDVNYDHAACNSNAEQHDSQCGRGQP